MLKPRNNIDTVTSLQKKTGNVDCISELKKGSAFYIILQETELNIITIENWTISLTEENIVHSNMI